MTCKKTQQPHREEALAVRRDGRKRAIGSSMRGYSITLANLHRILDVAHDQFAHERRLCILNVIDQASRGCLAAIANTSISCRRCTGELGKLIAGRGRPTRNVSDNVTTLTANAPPHWSGTQKNVRYCVEPDKPTQNNFVEKFDGRMRTKVLKQILFFPSTLPKRQSTAGLRSPAGRIPYFAT